MSPRQLRIAANDWERNVSSAMHTRPIPQIKTAPPLKASLDEQGVMLTAVERIEIEVSKRRGSLFFLSEAVMSEKGLSSIGKR